jgi:hypothetical protein
MLTGGPSQWYAEKLAGDEKNAIALTGYQDEESPGRQLLDLLAAAGSGAPPDDGRVLKIGDKTIPIQCDIGMYGLSAHADKMEILALAQSLAPRSVFFNHGNEDVVNALGAAFQKEYNGRVYIPKNGETFDLVIHNKRKPASGAARAALACMPPPGPNESSAAGADAADMLGSGESGAAQAGTADAPDTLERLWRFILDQYGVQKAFTLEDLYHVCYGARHAPSPAAAGPESEEGLSRFRALINMGAYFETEIKRPFMFHAVAEEDLRVQDSVMEANAMLRLADAYFPPASGLYKKGARYEEKIALLYFNFPDAAAKTLAEEIEAFELETGWKAEINTECNPGAAEQLINSLMGAQTEKKISFYRTESLFQVVAARVPEGADEICASFYQMTGLSLRIVTKGAPPAPARADKVPGQMEQNQALAFIDGHFSEKLHKIYKKSIKAKDGTPGIELSFITPAAGLLYESDIEWLMERTRWNIWVNKESNQHELLKAARELLAERDIAAKKLSWIPEKACVQAAFDGNAPLPADESGAWEEAREAFVRLTGADLTVKEP